jgi:hypothetical protein
MRTICTFAAQRCKIRPQPSDCNGRTIRGEKPYARLIVLAIVILVMPTPALADEFNVNTGPPANAGVAGGDCQGIYNAAMEKLSEQELADEGEERKEIVDCNHEQPCVDAAIKNMGRRTMWS